VNAERERMATVGQPEHGLEYAGPWYTWGPYVSERSWGTVREDYSADGDAWRSFPHEHARSRAYRWSEDGLAGICTLHQDLCLALALWNGRDPILKERLFGLTGHEGNHGEDAKECWWYLDATPSHSWLRWRYHYPQGAFPYADLVAENGRRTRDDPEYELLDTGAFDDDRYWAVEVTYAKRGPTDIAMQVKVTNCGPDDDVLHVLPTLWFRNVWSWGDDHPAPVLRLDNGDLLAEHERAGAYRLAAQVVEGAQGPVALFCDNSTNTARLYGQPAAESPAFPKDGINDHVVSGAATVDPGLTGTKAAWWYQLAVPAGASAVLRLRLFSPTAGDEPEPDWAGRSFDALLSQRRGEADAYYADLTPPGTPPERAAVMRAAFAGMVWGKQFYRYDVPRWLDGDPSEPAPPAGHATVRNARWRHLDAYDILSMPDPWEYPWFAAWDLGFHAVTLAHIDPAFAKYQLVLLCREWFMHPGGALPAYEWSFDDVNPPVHAWAAMKVFEIDAAATGVRDYAFLERVFQKLLLNFTWWVNREDPEGNNVFEGGFLGLDNVGPVDRSHLPPGYRLDQTDGTAWMAFYALSMLRAALVLAEHDEVYEDIATKFFEHFAAITDGMTDGGLWDPADGFFYDQLHAPDGTQVPLRVKSVVGVIPVLAAVAISEATTVPRTRLRKRFADFLARRSAATGAGDRAGFVSMSPTTARLMLTMVDPVRLRRVLGEVLDTEGMLSPHGIRSLSRRHATEPFTVRLDGHDFQVGYEPAESRTGLYGGNSNWRGPVWFPINYLVVEALERYDRYLGPSFMVELPTGSGHAVSLGEVAHDLRERLIGLFLPGPDGARPADGPNPRFRSDQRWSQLPLFYEYFDGDDGHGLGASHQTGWTGLVADLIRGLPLPAPPTV
jgi:Glycosyl hydrolase family 63 C-terminal domain